MTLPKLVRDKIPLVIAKNNQRAIARKLSDEEFRHALRQKLTEEVEEYLSSNSIEELADILEVVFALAHIHGVSTEILEQMRQEKIASKGAFSKRIVLLAIEEK